MHAALIITGYLLVGFIAACVAHRVFRDGRDGEPEGLLVAFAFVAWPVLVLMAIPLGVLTGVVTAAGWVANTPERRQRIRAAKAAEQRRAWERIRDETAPGTASHQVAVDMLRLDHEQAGR